MKKIIILKHNKMNRCVITNKNSKKRKYDIFCNNFQIPIQQSNVSRIIQENKRLKIEVQNLSLQIKYLEEKISHLSLEVKNIRDVQNKYIYNNLNKKDEIPCELEMFYYA